MHLAGSRGPRRLRLALLAGSERRGLARFDSQFWLGNYQPTERYVLTPAGSVQHRLGRDQSGYENLFLAGDWIKTGLDAGCVEAAVMGGMQASRAICGVPEEILGEDQTLAQRAAHDAAAERPGGPPAYVDYCGLGTAPHRWTARTPRSTASSCEADQQQARGPLRRGVHGTDGRRVPALRPLGHHVILTFGDVEKIKPKLFPWCEMGIARECQVAFWMPVLAIARQA